LETNGFSFDRLSYAYQGCGIGVASSWRFWGGVRFL